MKKLNLLWVLIACMTLSCKNPATMSGSETPEVPKTPPIITYEVILNNLYDELIKRETREVETPDLGTLLEGENPGNEMGQIANCQYVCNAINAYTNKNFQPAAGTATREANCEYLLKMIDKANSNSTSYGTGAYATKQVVDTAAITQALSLVILFQTQTWLDPGTYQIELPAGTYKMTAVSGRGGTGGGVREPDDTVPGGNAGEHGFKMETTFSIQTTVTVTVIVGGNGGNGENSPNHDPAGGAGGSPGNGQAGASGLMGGGFLAYIGGGGGGGGASGINDYYYVRGGNGGNAEDVNDGFEGTGIWGTAGLGGVLSGTAVAGTSTNESPYVKIERA
jgi:hypothetical protein